MEIHIRFLKSKTSGLPVTAAVTIAMAVAITRTITGTAARTTAGTTARTGTKAQAPDSSLSDGPPVDTHGLMPVVLWNY